jgi:hypothetical protein
MIDVIINETGGLTIAHDEKALDDYTDLEIALPGGEAVLTGPGGSRGIGALKPAMIGMLSAGMAGRMIRISGWSLAKICPLVIRIRQ